MTTFEIFLTICEIVGLGTVMMIGFTTIFIFLINYLQYYFDNNNHHKKEGDEKRMITKNVKTLITGDEGDPILTKAFHSLLSYMLLRKYKQITYEFADVSNVQTNKIIVLLDEPD